MYHHVSSCIIMYHHVSSCIIMYPHVSSCIIMYHVMYCDTLQCTPAHWFNLGSGRQLAFTNFPVAIGIREIISLPVTPCSCILHYLALSGTLGLSAPPVSTSAPTSVWHVPDMALNLAGLAHAKRDSAESEDTQDCGADYWVMLLDERDLIWAARLDASTDLFLSPRPSQAFLFCCHLHWQQALDRK